MHESPDFPDYYQILGLSSSAQSDDIKSAFRKKALVHHPDQNGNSYESQTTFALIKNAYDQLRDPQKRNQYDNYLKTKSPTTGSKKKPPVPHTQSKGTGNQVHFKNQINSILWDIEDIIEEIDKPHSQSPKDRTYYQMNVLMILTFFEKWVLVPGGFQDYFMTARNQEPLDPRVYVAMVCRGSNQSGHFPYTSVRNYFFDIRIRGNKYLDALKKINLLAPVDGTPLRKIDALIEAQNYCLFMIGALKKVLSGEEREVPKFTHSHECFQWP